MADKKIDCASFVWKTGDKCSNLKPFGGPFFAFFKILRADLAGYCVDCSWSCLLCRRCIYVMADGNFWWQQFSKLVFLSKSQGKVFWLRMTFILISARNFVISREISVSNKFSHFSDLKKTVTSFYTGPSSLKLRQKSIWTETCHYCVISEIPCRNFDWQQFFFSDSLTPNLLNALSLSPFWKKYSFFCLVSNILHYCLFEKRI